MDFLEIRRKAKERAGALTRAETGAADRAAAPAPVVPAESVPADAAEIAQPDFSRLEPFDAVLEAVHAAGGELTPIPDLPPWNEALTTAPVREERESPAAAAWNAIVDSASRETDPLDEFFFREGETIPGLPVAELGAPIAPAPVEIVDPLHEFLTFRLGDEEYAIDIERVREVLKAPAITDVPRAPDHVLGVIMVRGDVIAVFDPRRRLGLPQVDRAPSPRVVVADDGLGPIGLLVDRVCQVVRLRRSEIEPRPQGIGAVSAEYISGIGRQSGQLFIVLDLSVVLRGKTVVEAEEAA